MRPEWRRYAPLALYAAILAALISAALYFVRREFDIYLQLSLAITVIGLAAFVLLDPDRIRTYFSGRQARYGSNALILVLGFLGILVVVNYLVYENPQRWDLTENLENTLAPETLEVLESLEQPVIAEAYYSSNSSQASRQQADELLASFRINSDGMFDYEFVFPEDEPVRAQQAKVVQDRTIVLKMGDRQEQVTFADEQELANGLIRLIRGEERVVYFVSGHGERSLEEATENSYTQVKRVLESRYTVNVLNLLATGEIPDNADLVVIAGPTRPVTEGEVELIKEYVENGGSLMVMLEPTLFTEFEDQPDLIVEYLGEAWGIIVGDNMILDRQSTAAANAIGVSYGNHAITQRLSGIFTGFPTARSVEAGEQITGISKTELVFTSAGEVAWAETDLEGLENEEQPEVDEDEDMLGPVPMAVAAENTTTEARLVVFGDADFASNTYLTQIGNGDLLVNTTDWIVKQENLINLSPREQTQRFVVPPVASVLRLYGILAVCLLPGAVMVAGGVVWFVRRRRG